MKEKVTKFNLQDAFKALDEIDAPKVKGIKPNKDDHKELRESMRPTPKTDCLLEDYYDVQDQGDLQAAQADRQEEVAQAKLAKIEKIVDLDADSPEDLDPSYVGKTIVRCPQCMTLFYRNPEDLNASDEDKNIVNVGEVCPNCGNDSGYELVGKVAEVEPEETPNYENTNELDLNFEEPAEEGGEEIPAEEPAAEEAPAEEPELEPVPTEEAPAEENVEEEKPEEEKKEEAFEAHSGNILAEQVENALKEDVDADALNKKLQEHNDYIKVLQDEIKAEEEAVKNAKNDFIKKMHENNLASLKDALDKAIPEEVKAEAAVEDLPTAEDAAKDLTKNESLTEGSANELINGLQKLDGYKGLSGTSLKKLLDLYKDDMSGDPAFKLKNATVDDVTEWVGDFAEFLDTFADDIDMKFAKDIATNCPKVVKACRKAYKEANKEEAQSDEEAVDFIFEYSQEEGAKNDMTAREAIDAIDLTEALQEAAEKFPDPAKHELVDTVDGVEIYHCKNCGKYGAKINGKVVKKNSVEEIKNCINGKCESLNEDILVDVQLKDEDKVDPEELRVAVEETVTANEDIPDESESHIIVRDVEELEDPLAEDEEAEEVNEEICQKCGKDVEDPCETPREAEYCGNNLEEAEMHVMDKKEFEAAAEEAGIEKPVHEELAEDVVAKDAPEEGDKIDLEQRKVSEIHKGKEEHVPGSIVEESLNEAEIPEAEIEKMLNSKEFQTPVSEAEVEALLAEEPVEESFGKKFDAVEDIKDEAIEHCISESLTNVYENVKSFKLTSCELTEGKLVIEGDIAFKSGLSKQTRYVFTEADIKDNVVALTGINEDLDPKGTFTLTCDIEDNGTLLIAESLDYNYHIGENLVEGLATRK